MSTIGIRISLFSKYFCGGAVLSTLCCVRHYLYCQSQSTVQTRLSLQRMKDVAQRVEALEHYLETRKHISISKLTRKAVREGVVVFGEGEKHAGAIV